MEWKIYLKLHGLSLIMEWESYLKLHEQISLISPRRVELLLGEIPNELLRYSLLS